MCIRDRHDRGGSYFLNPPRGKILQKVFLPNFVHAFSEYDTLRVYLKNVEHICNKFWKVT